MRGFKEKRADALARFLNRLVTAGPRSAVETVSHNPRLQAALQQLSQGVREGSVPDTVYRRAIQQLGRGYDARATFVASPNAEIEVAKIPHAYYTRKGRMSMPRQEVPSGTQVRQVINEVQGHKAFQDAYLRSPVARALIDMPLLSQVDLRIANPATGQRWSPMYTMQAKDVKGGLPVISNPTGAAWSAARTAAGLEALERQGVGPHHFDAHQGNVGPRRSDGTLRERPVVFDYGRMQSNRFGGTEVAPFSGNPATRAAGLDIVTSAPGVNASPTQLEFRGLPRDKKDAFLAMAREAYRNIENMFSPRAVATAAPVRATAGRVPTQLNTAALAPAPPAPPAPAGRVPTQLNTAGQARAGALAAYREANRLGNNPLQPQRAPAVPAQ